ncbi:MAG: YafY family protein [Pseudomonadota bacterium]
MRKADRLNGLVHYLRRMYHAVTAETLAKHFEVSIRTLYRDIQDLQDSGVPILGEAGVGYVIDKIYHLPPIMFNVDEIEAIALGIGMVSNWTDEQFARNAQSAYQKIQATLNAQMLNELSQISTFSAPSHYKIPWEVSFTEMRECIRKRHFVRFDYLDLKDVSTQRTVRPLALISFSPVWLLTGWCELRQAFRNFRIDRISAFTRLDERYRDEKGKNLKAYLKTLENEKEDNENNECQQPWI